MNKVIMAALLLCIGFVVVGCEKTYSVKEFRKDRELVEEWVQKCRKMKPSLRSSSKNCQNLVAAVAEFVLESLDEGF